VQARIGDAQPLAPFGVQALGAIPEPLGNHEPASAALNGEGGVDQSGLAVARFA
jgi:hypothetical protein